MKLNFHGFFQGVPDVYLYQLFFDPYTCQVPFVQLRGVQPLLRF